jgi:hypothetical protein
MIFCHRDNRPVPTKQVHTTQRHHHHHHQLYRLSLSQIHLSMPMIGRVEPVYYWNHVLRVVQNKMKVVNGRDFVVVPRMPMQYFY